MSASAVSQSRVIGWRSDGEVNDAAVTTTSASATASAADGATRTEPMPSVSRASAASASARIGSRSLIASSRFGRMAPRTGRWLWPWTPAPIRATRVGRPWTAGANRRIATPETAAVRIAVIGPPSRIATGSPVAGSLRMTTALMAGRPSAALEPNPATHLIPSRSSAPPPSAPRR